MSFSAPDCLERLLAGPLRLLPEAQQQLFSLRFEQFLPDILRPLTLLYGQRPAFDQWLDQLLLIVARRFAERPSPLHQLDLRRLHEPDWYQKPDMLGYVAYTDRFATTLDGVTHHIPYLCELGVTYLHLMPLLQPRPGPNDGGYAVADYHAVNPALGSMADLSALAAQLRRAGISLCIDLVCNHTAKEHAWAQKALAGDPVYQDYYLMFPDRTLPDLYEATLPEIFPDFAAGNFTYYDTIARWVWTTFNEFQWDLNYANPAVLGQMLDNILFLANQGVEILRLDAVAFMWKRLGTDCQNQPEAHAILQALRALSRIAAPALLLKAEAIVAPNKLVPYLGRGPGANKECELAYHNVFMVLLWSSLAERQAVLMTQALRNMPDIPDRAAWITYVRCHDDIGWAVANEDAAAVGLDGRHHRAFLSDFYSGRFPGSFARGETFQHNPRTGDRRISGALASLAGLEQALDNAAEDAQGRFSVTDPAIALAIRRIHCLHSLIFAYGGIPVIYMGDEIGLLNNPTYLNDPELANDNRWLHRPPMDWGQAAERHNSQTITGQIYLRLRELAAARRRTPELHAAARRRPVWLHNPHLFGLMRESARGRLLVVANFAETAQTLAATRLAHLGFGAGLIDKTNGRTLDGRQALTLDPYDVVWLTLSNDDARDAS